jgi:hypothetical protein
MKRYKPEKIIQGAQQEQDNISELAKGAIDWFLSDGVLGSMYEKGQVQSHLADELNVTQSKASRVVSSLVGDIVDPVQQVVNESGTYVGVIDYKVYHDHGAYGYVQYNDKKGKRKRVVCARCVEKHKYDEYISRATQGEGSAPESADWDTLLDKISSHYADSHSSAPEDIDPGASLIQGTTISGNTSLHLGNQGNIDHDQIGGISTSDHHSRYSDSEARSAVNTFSGNHSDLSNINSNDHHSRYTNSEARSAVNTFSGSHNDLSNVGSSDHHSRYNDSEARSAVSGSSIDGSNFTGVSSFDAADARAAVENGDLQNVQFANIEDVGEMELGIDRSEGLLVDFGQGTAPVLDGNNLNAGNAISLSGMTGASANPTISVNDSGINHDNLSGVSAADHHTRYSDSEAQEAVPYEGVAPNFGGS